MSLRILHILHGMNRGGAETLVMNIYRNIDRQKVQFDFIVHTDSKCDFDDEIKQLGGVIYHCPEYKIINHSSYVKWWNKFFSQHKEYRIIHGHLDSSAAIYLKVAKQFGLITIAHSHNTSEGSGIKAQVKKALKHGLNRVADIKMGCSKEANKWLFEDGFEDAIVIKNSVDTNKFVYSPEISKAVKAELNIEDKFVVGHIGRFQHQKNHDFLIEIFKQICEKNQNSVLLLCGVGELQEQICHKVKSLGIEKNVVFLGLRDDIEKVCQAFDVFLFPSLYEGLPVTLIEMQAADIPCVISDVITEEVCITDIVKKVSLDMSPQLWADEVLKYINFIKTDTSSQIKAAGFDIKETALWLQNFYLNKSK